MELCETFNKLHEQLLLEQPWVEFKELLDDYGETVIWDFCAEEKGWMKQLYDLFAHHEMTSMNPIKNATEKITFNPDEIPGVVKSMLKDQWFRSRFVKDFATLTDEQKLKMKEVLPAEFMELI